MRNKVVVAILQPLSQSETQGNTTMGKNQYVVRHGDAWGVRGEGNQRLTREFDTQRDAIGFARGIARNQQSELRIQGRDGRFRDADSHGKDPFPPKG
ncbi:DUF2188 domain-containing protein [Pseudoroseicyclus sp. H15]